MKTSEKIVVPKVGDHVIWWDRKEIPKLKEFLRGRVIEVTKGRHDGLICNYKMNISILSLSEMALYYKWDTIDPLFLFYPHIDVTLIPKQNGFIKALKKWEKLNLQNAS
jgi:hypothetical protein